MGILDLLSTGNQYADPNGLYAGLMGHKGIAGYFENASNPAAMATQRPPQDGWEPGGQYPQGMPNGPPAAAAPHKPGFFGRGGAAWGILGSLSDAAAVAGGGQPYFGEDIRRQHELRMEQQNAMDRFIAQKQWERDNPPVPASIAEANAFNGLPQVQQDSVTAALDRLHPISQTGGETGVYRIPRGMGQPTGSNSPPPVGAVVDGHRFLGGNPNDQRSWAPVGGSSALPTTGFR